MIVPNTARRTTAGDLAQDEDMRHFLSRNSP
jgi:hypothetical protein